MSSSNETPPPSTQTQNHEQQDTSNPNTPPLTGDRYWNRPSAWDTASKKYNSAVGMSSQRACPRLVDMTHTLSPLNTTDALALEFGAGTGALTHALVSKFPTLDILATDISSQMLETLSRGVPDGANVRTAVVDMLDPKDIAPESFTHVFSTMALEPVPAPDEPEVGVGWRWMDLLRPGGVLALATWDFDERCGPQEVWELSARAVQPGYTAPGVQEPGKWMGHEALEQGVRRLGCEDVRVEVFRVGFDVGLDGFMGFVWDSGNPWMMQRVNGFTGDLDRVREEMKRVLEEEYDGGRNIPLYAALVVGRKPLGWKRGGATGK